MKSTITLSLARLSRRMKQRNGVRIAALSILLTAMVAAGMILGLRDSFAQSGGPTNSPGYSKVDDFLNGRRYILRNDDLVIGFNDATDHAKPSALLRFSSSCHVGLTPALKRINATHNFFSGAPNSHAKHWSYSLAALGQIDFGVVAVEIEMRSNALSKKNALITSYLTT
jgi:hypothetical protein